MNKLLFAAILMAFSLYGQGLVVTGKSKIDLADEIYHAKFFPNDEKILFTSSNYIGLNIFDISTQSTTKLNDYMNAGYENIFIENGEKIVFRMDEYINNRKYSSLISYDIEGKTELLLEKRIRNLSVPELLADGKIFYTADLSPKLKEIKNDTGTEAAINGETIVYQENAKIIVYTDNKKMIKPFGDGHYLWTEISPDQSKILFTYAGKGTFVCDLEGNILYEIGYANSPKWSKDGKYIVYMKDYDDGHKVTKSDIYVYQLATKKEINITNTPDTIELYPSWSYSGDKIVCNDDNGDIYLITLKFE